MSLLPSFQSEDNLANRILSRWKSLLDGLLRRPQLQSSILTQVSLKNGTTVINHMLGRRLAGWHPTRVRASASIYDQQDSNQTPAVTLVLVSNAAVVVDLEVF